MVNTSCANRVSSSSCPGRLTKLSRQFHREMSDQAIGICETSHATQVVQLIRGWIDSGIGTRATGVCVCVFVRVRVVAVARHEDERHEDVFELPSHSCRVCIAPLSSQG